MRWAWVLAVVLVATIARPATADPDGAGVPSEGAPPPRDGKGPTGEGAGDPRDGTGGTGGTGEGAGGPRDGAADLHVDHGVVAPEVSAGRRAAAIAVAIFPGILVRGAGSWIVGEHRAAKRLAATGAIGFAALVVGVLPIRVGGSSPYTIWSGVPLVVSGTGLFMSSWLGDIWAAAGGARWATTAVALPPWSVEVATTWQHDAYRERALLHAAGHLELGRLGLDGAGYVDARNAFRLGEARARWRLWGAAASGRAVAAGSGVVARATARLERDDPDRVTLATAEAELLGRLALDWLDPAIRGNFLELSAGGGLSRTGYPEGRHDTEAVLVAGFAWGAYLGDRGELRLYYDHRRNGLAGGLAASHAAGFLGSFGASTELRVLGPWAVHGELQIGDAWVTTLGVRYLGGR
jgi:hypothetical protein